MLIAWRVRRVKLSWLSMFLTRIYEGKAQMEIVKGKKINYLENGTIRCVL